VNGSGMAVDLTFSGKGADAMPTSAVRIRPQADESGSIAAAGRRIFAALENFPVGTGSNRQRW
jgi:hypothetical protein